jgi:DNA polymerase III delta subunit
VPAAIVLAGAERWFRQACLGAIIKKVLPHGDPGGALQRIDAKSAEDKGAAARILEELQSASLFSPERLVVVESAESAPAPPGSGRTSPIRALAMGALQHATEHAHLVLCTARPVKGRQSVPTGPLIEAGAWVVDCRALYDAPGPWERGVAPFDHELARFLVTRMRSRYHKQLRVEDAHALTMRVGSELGALEGALASLALYVGDRDEVSAEDVEATLGTTREDPLWRLSDAVLDGDRESALRMLGAVFARGVHDARGVTVNRPEALAPMLLATLESSWLRVLSGAEQVAAGEDGARLARSMGIPPFATDRFLSRCRRPLGPLRRLSEAFLRAERGLKGGAVPHRLALERLVVEVLDSHPRGADSEVRGPR